MYEFNNEVPIYLQIVDLITKEIISSKLKPGQKILSVREYAFVFKANPNTISKALQILEENKLIFTERTNGKYVTDNLDVINKYKEEIFNNKLNDFLCDMEMLGFSKDIIVKKIMEEK